MAISKKQINSKLRSVGFGEILVTETLDATNTEEILTIANPSGQLSFQRNGDLECTVDFSLNGQDYPAGLQLVIADATIYNFSTSVVKVLKVTRTAGSGKLIVAYV